MVKIKRHQYHITLYYYACASCMWLFKRVISVVNMKLNIIVLFRAINTNRSDKRRSEHLTLLAFRI